MEENNKSQLARMEEQIKNLSRENDDNQTKFDKFVASFYLFKDNDFNHLKLDVESLKTSLKSINKIVWVVLASILGLAFFVIRSIIIS